MKKNVLVVVFIMIMLLVTLLIGCGREEEPVPAVDSSVEVSDYMESETATDNETTEVISETAETEKQTVAAVSTERVSSSTTASVEKATAKTEPATYQIEQSVQNTTTHTEKVNETEGTTTESIAPGTMVTETTEAASTVPAEETAKTCYITVDGYCSNKSVEVETGESVYDILKKSGANISARNTGYGLYIEGINGRFEFDEGPTSGWTYTVNGSRVSKSCDKCEVKAGDKIVWTYVDEL